MRNKGFTLLEVLVSLSLFLLILTLTLKITAINKKIFHRLKEQEETTEFCFSAIEKMKMDILRAGELLRDVQEFNLLESIQVHENKLIIRYGEQTSCLLENAIAGVRSIQIINSKSFKKNRKIIIKGKRKGEITEIFKKQNSTLILKNPLSFDYKKEDTEIILIKEISYFLDPAENILRRKVNRSPAQPLIDGITFFEVEYSKDKNLLFIKFKKENEKFFQILIFPKNLSFSLRRK